MPPSVCHLLGYVPADQLAREKSGSLSVGQRPPQDLKPPRRARQPPNARPRVTRRRTGEKLLARRLTARCFKLGVPSCAAALVSRLPRTGEAGASRYPLRGCGGTQAYLVLQMPRRSPADLRPAPRVTHHAAARASLQTRDILFLAASCRVLPFRRASDPLTSGASSVSLPPRSAERWKGNYMMGHHRPAGVISSS